MAKKREIDVYRDWLGITDTNRPLNYYQLLRLKQFEDNVQLIRKQYRQLNAHVRKYASGDYADESQQLLNELARAMLCLTDAQRKREYDATLGRKVEEEGRRRTLEEILLAAKAISTEQLEKARRFSDAVGLELRDAIVQQKMVEPDVVTQAYAESMGMPYIDLRETQINADLAAKVPVRLARQHSCVPVMVDDGQLLVASPNPINPDTEEELRLRFELPIRTVLCTPTSVNVAIEQYFSGEAAQPQSGAATAAGGATAKRKSAPARPQMSAEEASQQAIKFGVVGFNITFIALMLLQYMTITMGEDWFGWWVGVAIRAALGGLLVGGGIVAYFLFKK